VQLIERGIEEKSLPSRSEIPDVPEAKRAGSRWPTLNTFEVDEVVSRCYTPLGLALVAVSSGMPAIEPPYRQN
jgi:hypothetical protein